MIMVICWHFLSVLTLAKCYLNQKKMMTFLVLRTIRREPKVVDYVRAHY